MEESAPLLTSIQTSITTWFTPTILFIFLNLMIATILFTSNLPKDKKQPPKQHSQNDARSPSILHRLKSFTSYPAVTSQNGPSPATNHHEQQPQSLELAATQYVFSHPFSHQQDLHPVSPNPNTFGLKLDPTRLEPEPDFNRTNEAQLANVQTHFVFENHTIEKVTTHFDFGSDCTETETETETETRPEKVTDTDTDENDDLESLDEVYSKIKGGHVNRTMSDTRPAAGEVPVKLPAKMKKSASLKSAFSHFEEEKVVEARRPATVRERRVAEEDDVEVDSKADDFINKFKHQLKLQRMDSIIRYKDMVNRGGGK
ncbi:hypothetical protein SSX86_002084 [Deinandra increscens subsp. villosa]|uniref:DUF4408 domain-containing protein n=1 Tax=Deinandra increscens subsp. villosa TaxID=3103831 RepID=A0AAP0HAY0_9ASTR